MDPAKQVKAASQKIKRATDLLEMLPSSSPLSRPHRRCEIREALAEARTLIEMAEAQL